MRPPKKFHCNLRGIVIKNTGSWYTVKGDNGETVECKIKGNFRLKGIRSTNPVAIGDHVEYIPEPDKSALITKIYDRKNYVIRKAVAHPGGECRSMFPYRNHQTSGNINSFHRQISCFGRSLQNTGYAGVQQNRLTDRRLRKRVSRRHDHAVFANRL